VAGSNTCQTTSDVSRGIGDRDFDMSRTHCNRNSEIAICDFAMKSQPLDKNEIWTVDLRHREIGDRESRRHVHSDIENAETPMRGLTEVMC
jgi:hypothetical protein